MFLAPNTPMLPDRAETVTPNDSTIFNASAVIACGAGDIKVQPAGGGAPLVFPSWPACVPVPCMCTMVYNTGTTATNIRRVY